MYSGINSWKYQYAYINGLVSPNTIECREAIATTDNRYFYFLQKFDGSIRYFVVVEVFFDTANINVLSFKQTILETYCVLSTSGMSYWKIFE